MADLLDYSTSPLVLILKVAAPLLFLVALVLYIAIRRFFTGKIRLFLDTLILFTFFTVVAGWLRIYGDGTEFGLTKEYSLRWFQSLAYIVSAGCFIYAGYQLLHLCGEEKP